MLLQNYNIIGDLSDEIKNMDITKYNSYRDRIRSISIDFINTVKKSTVSEKDYKIIQNCFNNQDEMRYHFFSNISYDKLPKYSTETGLMYSKYLELNVLNGYYFWKAMFEKSYEYLNNNLEKFIENVFKYTNLLNTMWKYGQNFWGTVGSNINESYGKLKLSELVYPKYRILYLSEILKYFKGHNLDYNMYVPYLIMELVDFENSDRKKILDKFKEICNPNAKLEDIKINYANYLNRIFKIMRMGESIRFFSNYDHMYHFAKDVFKL